MKKVQLIVASAVAAAFLVGVALPAGALPVGHVVIRGFAFSPANVNVDNDVVAPTVAWTNTDFANHHPHADNGCFNAGLVGPGLTVTASMGGCGTGVTAYHCHIHPFMTGTVTVA